MCGHVAKHDTVTKCKFDRTCVYQTDQLNLNILNSLILIFLSITILQGCAGICRDVSGCVKMFHDVSECIRIYLDVSGCVGFF
jgi:hypothetical protein